VAGDGRTFGARGEVDPVRHLIGTATHWGRCPPRDIAYLLYVPRENDGHTPHHLTVGHVPVDGFWSLSVYDANGHFFGDAQAARSVNSLTARRDGDGSVTIRLSDGETKAGNRLQIGRGWRYLVRLYRPRAEILGGKWQFPQVVITRGAVAAGLS
jgi:hypothetical protein